MDGFIVAYFTRIKINRIVPVKWIEDVESHLEKFWNGGLNSAQIFTCYFTNNADAFDIFGVPISCFEPNFDVPFRDDSNADGRFTIKLKAYRGKDVGILTLFEKKKHISDKIS